MSPSAIQEAYKSGYRQLHLSWHRASGCFAGIKTYGAFDSSDHNWAVGAKSPPVFFTLPGYVHRGG